MDLNADDFELFDLPRRQGQTRADIDARWKSLQGEVHPDRFAAQGAAAQRIAMQWAVRVNEAYQRLKDPLRRAAYLCELAGVPIHAETNTAMPGSFLMQQMEWRESLDDAVSLADVQAIADQVEADRRLRLQRITQLLDDQHDATSAAQEVRALMFIERFADDIDGRLEALGQ